MHLLFLLFLSENLGNLTEATSKHVDALQLSNVFLFYRSQDNLKKACLHMEPKFFQEKQISYLLGKAQNESKLVRSLAQNHSKKKCQTEEHKLFQQNMKLSKHFSQNEGTA